MQTTCFVSYELFPVTRGGCGALLHNVAAQLLAAGDQVIFLLDVSQETFERFDLVERLKLPNASNCVAYRVESLLGADMADISAFNCWYDWRAYVLHQAALRVHEAHRPALIEFFDYHGVAYYALSEKIALSEYEGSHIAVRFHATIEAMDTVDLTNSLHPDLYTLYSLERASLVMADSVIVPSQSFYEQALRPLYPFIEGRQTVGVPPLRTTLKAVKPGANARAVLFYGRLFAIKGVDLMVDAAIAWLRQRPQVEAEFYFLGGDSRQPPDGAYPYAEYLIRRIPSDLKARFHFLGHSSHEDTETLLQNVRFAVFPNRYESFCYAAHEMYVAGVPMIISDIPAFKDFFKHEENCLTFERNSSDELAVSMDRMWADAALRQRLAYPYPVIPDEIARVYRRGTDAVTQGAGSQAAYRVLVLIMADHIRDAAPACLAAREAGCEPVVLLRVAVTEQEPSAVLFGRNVRAVDDLGVSLDMHALRTLEAMVILQNGDRVDADYLRVAARTLKNRAEIAYVSCWRQLEGRLTAFALPLHLDVLPFMGQSPHTRAVMRTVAGRPLLDVFDPGMGEYSELKYLWELVSGKMYGLVIPRPWIEVKPTSPSYPAPKLLSYLLNGNRNPDRRTRIAQYAVASSNKAGGLSAHRRKALDDMSALPTPMLELLLVAGRSLATLYRRARTVLVAARESLPIRRRDGR